MIRLSNRQIAEYFHRSYTAVDGLWFMKVEEKYGFDVALDIDNEVWKVFAKMQARLLKSLGQTGDGIDSLHTASWNGRLSGGSKAASGLYIYLVRTDNYGRGKGKFFIVW